MARSTVTRFPASVLVTALLVAFPGVLLSADPDGAYRPSTLGSRLNHISQQVGFEISGLEKLEPGAPVADADASVGSIKRLLKDYDYVMVHGAEERIQRLIILGKKRGAPVPAPVEENVLKTRRQGDQHFVSAVLRGSAGGPVQTELMVDTGASLLVLPQSLAASLGVDLESLESRELQTAKGRLNAKIARLGAIELGTDTQEDVEAAFVEDEHLGGHALLGMNVLGRYLFILDDEHDELTLIPDEQ